MKNILLITTIAILFAGCSDRSTGIGEFIRGCESRGLKYKSCSCLAEKIVSDATDEEFRSANLMEQRITKIDSKILKKCIGKQDAEDTITRMLVSQGVSGNVASCFTKKLLKRLSKEEIELIETPVFGQPSSKMKDLTNKVLNIVTDPNIVKECTK